MLATEPEAYTYNTVLTGSAGFFMNFRTNGVGRVSASYQTSGSFALYPHDDGVPFPAEQLNHVTASVQANDEGVGGDLPPVTAKTSGEVTSAITVLPPESVSGSSRLYPNSGYLAAGIGWNGCEHPKGCGRSATVEMTVSFTIELFEDVYDIGITNAKWLPLDDGAGVEFTVHVRDPENYQYKNRIELVWPGRQEPAAIIDAPTASGDHRIPVLVRKV